MYESFSPILQKTWPLKCLDPGLGMLLLLKLKAISIVDTNIHPSINCICT